MNQTIDDKHKFMKLKTPINENYAATVVEVREIRNLPNCDNVTSINVYGNTVITGKDVTMGTKGIFFPVETKLSEQYLYENNLYRDNTKNKDINEKGYFEENGRIKCMKFRGNKSEGLFMPISSLLFTSTVKDLATLSVGDTFDDINGIKICEKYIPRVNMSNRGPGGNQTAKPKKSRIIDGQFRFHSDTSHLGRNMFKITPNSIISITNKLHGSSFIVSNILCKKKLSWGNQLLKKLGVSIIDTNYDLIWSSRKVIKNDGGNYNHYYKEDIWAEAAKVLKDHLYEGLTIYGELVGFTPSGGAIQGLHDYGYAPRQEWETYTEGLHFGVKIYRITQTTPKGTIHEFTAFEVQEWCKQRGLSPVPQYFYGYAKDFLPVGSMTDEQWRSELLSRLLIYYNMEKDCELCINKVPAEGIVVRVEGLDYEAFKLKSFRFKEQETKDLDKGIVDMETEESLEQ